MGFHKLRLVIQIKNAPDMNVHIIADSNLASVINSLPVFDWHAFRCLLISNNRQAPGNPGMQFIAAQYSLPIVNDPTFLDE